MITGSVAGAGNSLWGSGFLPTVHQGIEFRSSGDPVLFLSNPKGINRDDRREIVDGINFLNRQSFNVAGDPEINTRISQYEMAFRMQASVPELMDTTTETADTHTMYGTQPGKPSFANNCLLARRLVSVVFVLCNCSTKAGITIVAYSPEYPARPNKLTNPWLPSSRTSSSAVYWTKH